jgi:tRNA uracil 4-sulfurtransferase
VYAEQECQDELVCIDKERSNMYNSFLIKYGEIGIKGNNRHIFEDALCRRIKEALNKLDGEFEIKKERGRIYVNCSGDWHYDEAVSALTRIFGIVGICPVVVLEATDFENLKKGVVQYIQDEYPNSTASFKVKARRINKSFPKKSMEIDADLGEAILDAFPSMHVDVHNPDILLDIEIREFIYVYSKIIPGPGGMPVGTGGSATLLLSGGIDSPVAGWMVAKRGVSLDAVYFHAPPYTSERAKQKVVDLAKEVALYTGPIKLHVVNFTDIQLYIYDTCPHEELTIIMRRYMMRIAEHFAKENHSLGLVTGESIGQVASQTMQSLVTTNAVCTLPVYRPLIAFDKNDIVIKAKEIGTYETSILPFEDCCTIFVAKHPVTKPNLKTIEHSEMRLKEKIDDLMKEAIETTEIIEIK